MLSGATYVSPVAADEDSNLFFNLPLETRRECQHRIPRIFLLRIDFRENLGIPKVLTLCVQIFVSCIIDNIFKKDICFKQVEIISV